MARVHLDLPAIIVLSILGSVFVSMKVLATVELCRHTELPTVVRALFAVRNLTLLIFLGVVLIGLLWPHLWDRPRVALIGGVIWFACWLAFSAALQVSLRRQSKIKKKLSETAKAQ